MADPYAAPVEYFRSIYMDLAAQRVAEATALFMADRELSTRAALAADHPDKVAITARRDAHKATIRDIDAKMTGMSAVVPAAFRAQPTAAENAAALTALNSFVTGQLAT